MPYQYINGMLQHTETETAEQATILAPFHYYRTTPQHIAETESILRDIASTVLNIELAHSITEILAATHNGNAFYTNSPDVAPYLDGFVQHCDCTLADYLADLQREADQPAGVPLAFILQAGADNTIALCIPCLN